jgi:hypothetical protein
MVKNGLLPFPKLMEMVESLIKQGKAYVDDTPKQQMKDERAAGTQSKRRNNTVEENLSLWREMINGTEIGMQCYVRGKLDMQDPNKVTRHSGILFTTAATLILIIVLVQNTRYTQHMILLHKQKYVGARKSYQGIRNMRVLETRLQLSQAEFG